ncbi:MAG: hypothetical protein EKK63_02450 [Acinetobacter sp.]|uniref:hypothetical protein n=1 Tax=Acinetobacter sp. TaxID=472 RepID=UPI000F9523FF|nr:hypothetical protein [Acinetobacter sp.]RUP42177.1 MAG: hypothetical protein EKK63_02450 [Acinetobacter sp.]
MTPTNCYDCKFQGTVPGSAHSCCTFIPEDMRLKLMLLYLSGKQLVITQEESEEPVPILNLDPHGIKNGWANWPVDFDPVWVSDCKLFTSK